MTQEQALKDIPNRLQEVWKMKDSGCTFTAIGKKIGVCGSRARELYFRACRRIQDAKEDHPWRNLQGNSYWAVRQFLGTAENELSLSEQREFIENAIREGLFHPDKKVSGLKWKNYEHICQTLGIKPKPSEKMRCPCCGHILGKKK